MTEEPPHRPAPPVNGSSDRAPAPIPTAAPAPLADPPSPVDAARPSGGRLKFFKDGKFILELARTRPREGERTAWVAVPRKSLWTGGAPATPGHGAHGSHGSHGSERAASLSVSDDNSSVQSSPWQRDHRWKQSTPQRGLSKELVGCYLRPAEFPSALLTTATARRKRRRPFDADPARTPDGPGIRASNGAVSRAEDDDSEKPENGASGESNEAPEKHIAIGKFKFFKHKCDTKENVTLKVYRKSRKSRKRKKLCSVIQMLADRLPAQTLTVNAKISNLNFKQEHAMVSPRKRILRELERVSLGLEDGENKKSRPRDSPTAPKPGPSHVHAETSPIRAANVNHFNGIPRKTPRRETPASKPVSNYSINSLLSKSEDSAPRRSPETYSSKKSSQLYNSTPHKTDSPLSAHSPDPSSSPDGLDHRHRSLRPPTHAPHSFSSPGRSGHSSASPRPPEKYFYQDLYAGQEDSPLAYQLYQPAPYLPHAAYLGAAYPPYSPHGPPPLWLPCPVLPPGPWAPLSHPLLTDRSPREETSSDLPLNLSKH